MFNKLLNGQLIFYSLISVSLIAVLFSNPFLTYPYDIYYHLTTIDKFSVSFDSPKNRGYIYHFLWAKIFNILNIEAKYIFLRAKIIHISQTLVAFFCVYHFSKVVIRNIFTKIDLTTLRYLCFWSVVIWLTIFATFSVNHHLIWNMWYSVNHQITLPLFWYLTAITLTLFWEKMSLKKTVFFVVQILLLSVFIIKAHSMEYGYYLMYMTIFVLFYPKFFKLFKKWWHVILSLIAIFIYILSNLIADTLPILISGDERGIFERIISNGEILINGHNRSFAVINELMVVILLIGIFTIFYGFKKVFYNSVKHKKYNIDIRKVFFIITTSLFIFIPLFKSSSGLFAEIIPSRVIHRVYFSSSLFVLLPIFIYYLALFFKKQPNFILKVNIIFTSLLLITLISSKYNPLSSGNYYKNIISLKNSFDKEQVGFHLSQKQIDEVDKKIKEYIVEDKSKRPILFYARDDIAFVIKYILRKNAYWNFWDTKKQGYKKIYSEKLLAKPHVNEDYLYVLFDTPKGFPDYVPFRN